jgi:hypothetical protein
MTYYEVYKKYNSIDKLESCVNKDISTALIINKDRIKYILEAANQVIKENDWTNNLSRKEAKE